MNAKDLQKALDQAAADLARLYAATRQALPLNDPRIADIGHALYLIKRAAA